MTVFNPATFRTTSNKPHHIECMFNGPVIGGTKLPVAKKKKGIFGNDVYLIGWANKVGCFSAIELPANDIMPARVDVAFYIDSTPNALKEEDIANAIYEQYPLHNGWGFTALAKLEELLDEEEEISRVINE